MGSCGMDAAGSRWGPMGGSCERGSKISGPIKGGKHRV